MAWASVRPSVCLSVTLLYCVKTVQARITKFSPWAASQSLVFRDRILCSWVREFPSNESVKEGYLLPLKRRYVAVIGSLVWKQLQIDTDMLLIITRTDDRLFRFINIDDFERPWTPPPKNGFLVHFLQLLDATHISALNCDEMAGDRPRQPAYEIFSIQRRF